MHRLELMLRFYILMNKIITFPFTADFIECTAEYICHNYVDQSRDLTRLAVVFGGKRPALFLKRALAKRIKQPFLPPHIISIDELVDDITRPEKLSRIPDLDHCFIIYQLVKDYAPRILKGRESFIHFLPWAREILNFIEQLDLEESPVNALEMLKEHAALGFNVPEDINFLLESLMVLRVKYHAYLEGHHLTSRGFQYLSASRMVKNSLLSEYDELLFCNFFYLHRSEMTIIKDLFKRQKASLLMQGDQRKWPALKRIGREFAQDISEGAAIAERNFNLHVYGAFDMHAQAGVVTAILNKIPQLDRTVIVLPNPDALLPLLSSFDQHVGMFNISLGYPLKRSSIFALIEAIIQAHQTMKGQLYYSRDYLRLLRHPLIKGLDIDAIDAAEAALTGEVSSDVAGQIYISIEDIIKLGLGDIHDTVIHPWSKVANFSDLARVINQWSDLLQADNLLAQYPLNSHVLVRLKEIALEWANARIPSAEFDRADLFKIMQERLSQELIAFKGSPLRGLQVLGLIETRSLSFDHVIVLDLNEGVLPNLNVYEPLIPREVMIKLNLDRLELEEEIQAYQFMRLISSAKDVHLIYQERPDKSRSRFLEELIWEKERQEQKTKVVEIIRPSFMSKLTPSFRKALKTPAMIDYLRRLTFSATSVNAYLRNPYVFYQQYVLGLRPVEDMLDDPQSRHVGTFIHGLLEDAFRPFIGRKPVIDKDFKKAFRQVFEKRFHDYFGRGMRSDAFLLRSVIENRLERFLDVEAARIERDVASVRFIERKFEDVLNLNNMPMRFSFRVDRVDQLNDGTILILDYKTGGSDVVSSSVDLSGALSRELLRDKLVSFQMPLYLYYLDKQYPQEPVNAALYHLRTMQLEKFITAKTQMPRQALIESYMKALSFIIAEIFNPEIPFLDDPVDII